MRVEYMHHSGSDLLVVDAARASFGKQSGWVDLHGEKDRTLQMLATTELDSDRYRKLVAYRQWLRDREAHLWSEGNVAPDVLKYEDFSLIHFLSRERHLLPFRHPTITFRCQAPMFVARQLGKHQAGMSWSEESRRYVTTEPTFYWPDTWRKKAANVKQGSSDESLPSYWQTEMEGLIDDALRVYNSALAAGMAPELARMILPQNMNITWVWTGTLLAWVYMIKERTVPTAQRETQEFVRMVESNLRERFPASMDALVRTSL